MKVKYVYTCNYDDYVPHNISSLQLRAGTYIRWLVFFWETVHVVYIAQGAYIPSGKATATEEEKISL